MPHIFKVDVAIVGAGIVGMAHAYLAARAGKSVAVFERNPTAMGASIRNFGMIRPIGLPAGPLHKMALRSRALWLEFLTEAELPYSANGSLHAAYHEDEAAVAREFSERAPARGYECSWLDPDQTLAHSRALRPDGLLGALWSSTELNVDPRQVMRTLPHFLAERYGVQFHFNSPVQRVEEHRLSAVTLSCEADAIVLCGGDDFQTLFPECFHDSGLTRCKLQMMRTVPQPDAWKLGPSLAFGLTFRHYPAFEICSTLPALKDRIARETPDFDRFGIHVMVSQTSLGELTIGDSHEYGLALNVFDKPEINRLILDYAKACLHVPTLEIAELWHGVYALHPEHAWLRRAPAEGVRVVTFTSGIGMTMSFGVAEETLLDLGVSV